MPESFLALIAAVTADIVVGAIQVATSIGQNLALEMLATGTLVRLCLACQVVRFC
jgi:hypothetical protein